MCADDSGIFHYFCDIYDAGAYKKMDKDNTEVFEMMSEYDKEEVDKCLKQFLKNSSQESN